MRGTVKWFNKERGYGFITKDGTDYFVHFSRINGSGFKYLQSGEIVSFDLEETERGMVAVNVKPILTIKMVEEALKKDGLFLRPFEEFLGEYKFLVVDENNILQTYEQGISLVEVASYAGIDVSEIVCDFMTGKEISDVTNIYIKLPKEKQYEIDDLCKYLWEIEKSKEITICYSDEKAEKVVFEENMPNGISEYKYKILQTVVTKFVTKGGGMVLRIHSANSNDVIMGFSCLNMEIKCLSVDEIKYTMELQPDGSRVTYDNQEYAVADICF